MKTTTTSRTRPTTRATYATAAAGTIRIAHLNSVAHNRLSPLEIPDASGPVRKGCGAAFLMALPPSIIWSGYCQQGPTADFRSRWLSNPPGGTPVRCRGEGRR